MKRIEINNKHYQECGVVMIPTENMTGIVLHGTGIDPLYEINTNKGMVESLNAVQNIGGICQHLYILSNEEIKIRDWCIMLDSFGNVFSNPQQYTNPETQHLNKGLRKIVATTDSSLGYTDLRVSPVPNFCDLPQIPRPFIQYFIEEYNQGNIVKEVLIEIEKTNFKPDFSIGYHEPGSYNYKWKIKVDQDNKVNIFIKQYPIGGYTPGYYSCKCVTCKQNFIGNKRSVQCEPCAVEMTNVKIQVNNKNGIEEIKEKMFSREEVIGLLVDVIDSCTNGTSSNKQDFESWISENLK
jgi:hypothetical protein